MGVHCGDTKPHIRSFRRMGLIFISVDARTLSVTESHFKVHSENNVTEGDVRESFQVTFYSLSLTKHPRASNSACF